MRTQEDLEQAVLSDYDALKGKVVRPTGLVICFAGDDSLEVYPERVLLRIVGPDKPTDGIIRWMDDEWIDPVYDVALVDDPAGEIPEGAHVSYIHGRSYSAHTGPSTPPAFEEI